MGLAVATAVDLVAGIGQRIVVIAVVAVVVVVVAVGHIDLVVCHLEESDFGIAGLDLEQFVHLVALVALLLEEQPYLDL